MNKRLSILWFRQDLRLSDNPALTAAIAQGDVLPIYILDNESPGDFVLGGASRWWLHHSLQSLNISLQGKLNIYTGEAGNIIATLCQRFTITAVYWNRCYEPWRIARDKNIKQQLLAQGIHSESFNSSLLNEPWTTLKKDDTPYKVFTPYYRQASRPELDTSPLPTPKLPASLHADNQSCSV